MDLMKIPGKLITELRHTRRYVRRGVFEDMPELNRRIVYLRANGPWLWEVTIGYDLMVTLRKVHRDTIHDYVMDATDNGKVFHDYARSAQPEELARTIRRIIRTHPTTEPVSV